MSIFVEWRRGGDARDLVTSQPHYPRTGELFRTIRNSLSGTSGFQNILVVWLLWGAGVRSTWNYYGGIPAKPTGRVRLPAYPFERKRLYWLDPPDRKSTRPNAPIKEPGDGTAIQCGRSRFPANPRAVEPARKRRSRRVWRDLLGERTSAPRIGSSPGREVRLIALAPPGKAHIVVSGVPIPSRKFWQTHR